MTTGHEMTPLERALTDELKKALSLRDDAELVLNLNAKTRVGETEASGAALSVTSSGASTALRMFAPTSLLASTLIKSFAAWGPEYLGKLKAHQR